MEYILKTIPIIHPFYFGKEVYMLNWFFDHSILANRHIHQSFSDFRFLSYKG